MMNDKYILPLYLTTSNRRWSKINLYDLKWLIVFLLVLSTLAVYVLFRNLPSEVSSNIHDILIPDVHAQVHQQDQQPEPPIDQLNKQPIVTAAIETSKRTAAPVVQVQVNAVGDVDDEKNKKRREKVKEMTNLAWNNYESFAWGQNELKPISKTGHSAGIFGASTRLGATIVDALDTMYIQGNMEAYKKGRDWIEANFNMNIDADVSAFEINIRFIGGLLSMYSLTKDKMFLDKAIGVADAILPIFNSRTGLPYALVNPVRKSVSNYHWASGGCSILAELGTLSLEFQYLSDASGSNVYAEKVKRIQTVLNEVQKENGLYYNYINPQTGTWCMKHASVGALGDSFYEYLLKLWVYSNKKDDVSLKMYLDSMNAIQKYMLDHSQGGLTFIGEYKSAGRIEKKMDHLACFIAGLFALTAMHVPLNQSDRALYTQLAVNITHTCHESYARTATKLGPEAFHFERLETEAQAIKSNERYYILRPEVIEAYFYLWRLTKQQMYRDWAWEAVEALEKHCRTENGFSGIKDVYETSPSKDDVQQSFFLAETLKYLYLTFSDDSVIPLDKYVFNTEAHPIPIKS